MPDAAAAQQERKRPEPYIPQPTALYTRRERHYVLTKPLIMPVKSAQLRKSNQKQRELEEALLLRK